MRKPSVISKIKQKCLNLNNNNFILFLFFIPMFARPRILKSALILRIGIFFGIARIQEIPLKLLFHLQVYFIIVKYNFYICFPIFSSHNTAIVFIKAFSNCLFWGDVFLKTSFFQLLPILFPIINEHFLHKILFE